MKMYSLFFIVFITCCVNSFASVMQFNTNVDMCLSAHLKYLIHHGDIAFYNKDALLGAISVHGVWVDVIVIRSINGGYFKDQQDFEDNKYFLSVRRNGESLEAHHFTYHPCNAK